MKFIMTRQEMGMIVKSVFVIFILLARTLSL